MPEQQTEAEAQQGGRIRGVAERDCFIPHEPVWSQWASWSTN